MDYFDNYPLTGIKSSGWAPKPDPALPKYCAKCNETYPIVDAIPNLLPPDLRDKTNQSSSKK